MATRLTHTPAPFPHDATAAQVNDLVDALHESGLLRALAGAVRAYPDLATRLVQSLDPESVRALAELGAAVRVPDTETAKRVASGVREGVQAASIAVSGRAPSMLDIVRAVRSEDVRRGLGAVVAGLGAFGREVGRRR